MPSRTAVIDLANRLDVNKGEPRYSVMGIIDELWIWHMGKNGGRIDNMIGRSALLKLIELAEAEQAEEG